MSTSTFTVDVAGTYVARDPSNRPVKKPYKITATLPSLIGAISVLRDHILPTKLQDRYGDYERVRTVVITNTKENTAGNPKPLPLSAMNAQQLTDYIATKKLPIDPTVYEGDVVLIREAIALASTRPEEYKEKEESYRKEQALKKELAELNPPGE